MGKLKRPTCTRLVLEALRGGDDFMTQRMLRDETSCTTNQVSAACHGLRRGRAADVIVQPDSSAWWFALPPEGDTRLRAIDEIQAEIHRTRKVKLKIGALR